LGSDRGALRKTRGNLADVGGRLEPGVAIAMSEGLEKGLALMDEIGNRASWLAIIFITRLGRSC